MTELVNEAYVTKSGNFYSIFNDHKDTDTVHIELPVSFKWTAEELFELADSLYDKGIDLAGEEVFIKWHMDVNGLTAESLGHKGPVGPDYESADPPGANGPTGGIHIHRPMHPLSEKYIDNVKAAPILSEFRTKFAKGEKVIFSYRNEKYLGIVKEVTPDNFSQNNQFKYTITSGEITFLRHEDEIEKYA